jgi:hypothetical protein
MTDDERLMLEDLPRRPVPKWMWVALVALLAGLAGGVASVVEELRERSARSHCGLGPVASSIHSYHDAHGTFPPPAIYSKDGVPLLSWRVLILPELGQGELYREFKLDEPWDSPHNIRLLDRMPSPYMPRYDRWVKTLPHHAMVKVLVGPGAAFEGPKGIPISDFPDGRDRTILLIEAGDPVPWTKPEEITFIPGESLRLKGLFRDGFRIIPADSVSYRFIRTDVDPVLLQAAITRNGGEQVPPPW